MVWVGWLVLGLGSVSPRLLTSFSTGIDPWAVFDRAERIFLSSIYFLLVTIIQFTLLYVIQSGNIIILDCDRLIEPNLL